MKRKDQISGVFWFLISLIVIQQSLSMRLGTFRSPGSGLIPLIWGVILAILSVIIIIKAFLRTTESTYRMQPKVDWSSLGKLGVVIGILLAFTFIFSYLGFFFSSFWILVFLFRDSRKWWVPFFIAALTVVSCFLLFHVFLQIQFPRGPWGIQ